MKKCPPAGRGDDHFVGQAQAQAQCRGRAQPGSARGAVLGRSLRRVLGLRRALVFADLVGVDHDALGEMCLSLPRRRRRRSRTSR